MERRRGKSDSGCFKWEQNTIKIARDITREHEHCLIPGGPRDITLITIERVSCSALRRLEQLEFHASTGTARFYNDESRANEAPALPASGGILARVNTWTPTAQLRFEVEKGFHVNSS